MATLYNASPGTNFLSFKPISSVLDNLPNGAGTLAAICAKDNSAGAIDVLGLTDRASGTVVNWYHCLQFVIDRQTDDDGIVGVNEGSGWPGGATTDWYIIGVTWPAGGAALERFHHYSITSGGSWIHNDSGANNGGTRAGPGTTNGAFRAGYFNDQSGSGGIALIAAWVGNALDDSQFEELSVNGRTSDWWNNSDGRPDLLVECTSLTPTDIGNNPSTFEANHGLTIANPAVGALTWNFDGQGTPPVEHQSGYYSRRRSMARR